MLGLGRGRRAVRQEHTLIRFRYKNAFEELNRPLFLFVCLSHDALRYSQAVECRYQLVDDHQTGSLLENLLGSRQDLVSRNQPDAACFQLR